MTSKVVPCCTAVNLAILLGFLITGCSSQPTYDEDRYLAEARSAQEAEDIDEAHRWAQRAVEEGRRQGEARKVLADVFRTRAEQKLEAGDAAGAHSDFLRAAEHEPTTRRRGDDLVAALEAGERGGLPDETLLEVADRAIEANPHAPDLRREAARLAEDVGDDQAAVTHYQWLVSADPDDTRAGLRLGILYLIVDRPADAAAVLETVHNLTPENIQASLNLAEAYAELERYRDAAALFELMLEQVPDHPAVLRQYADLEQRRGNHQRARQLREKAAERSPGIEQRDMRPLR